MLLNNYQSNIISIIQKYVNDGWILSFSFSVDPRSDYVGFIQGSLEFLQGSRLFFKEYVDLIESDRLTRDKDRAISLTSLSAIVRVSVESVAIVNSLPPLQEK
jgi:hypothetical protein